MHFKKHITEQGISVLSKISNDIDIFQYWYRKFSIFIPYSPFNAIDI